MWKRLGCENLLELALLVPKGYDNQFLSNDLLQKWRFYVMLRMRSLRTLTSSCPIGIAMQRCLFFTQSTIT